MSATLLSPPRDLERDPSIRASTPRPLPRGTARALRRACERDRRKALRRVVERMESGAELVDAHVAPASEGPVDPGLLHRESGQLREHLLRRGLPLSAAHELTDRNQPVLAGGATGLGGAAFMHNLPPEGSYHEDTNLFFQETERNDVPQEQKAYTGLGGAPIDLRISNVGLLGKIRLTFVGTLTVAGAGTVTSTYQWPWNVLKRFTLNANGQTSLVSCEGVDLRARRQRIFRNPRDPVSSAPATDTTTVDPSPGVIANGDYAVQLVYEIPITHDDYTLTGALFAQSDQIYLNWRIQPAAVAELFTLAGGSTATLTGTIHSTLTFFDIPFADVAPTRETPGGRKVLVPDLSWLHGFLAADQPFSNTGDVKTPFIRTAGQLIAYYAFLDNGGAAQIEPTAASELRFEYGGNRRPRVYNPPAVLLEENAQSYNGRVRPGYIVLDFEKDNPRRDLVYPKGVTELLLATNLPASVVVNPNAHVHFVEETLFAGR